MSEDNTHSLINEAMPGHVKVDKTLDSVASRMESLDSSRVLLPFEFFIRLV